MDVGMVLVRPDPTSAATARHEVALDLSDHGLTRHSIDDVVLVVSELVSNALLHAHTASPIDLDVSWDVGEYDVVVRVDDGSPAQPQLRASDARDTGGRGLAIVAAIASEWGVRSRERGKQVWARVPVHRAD